MSTVPDSAIKWLLRNREVGRNLLFLFLAAGMSYWALSFFIGIHSVVYEQRQIGYLAAVNWSIVYPVLLPMMLYVVVDLMRQAFGSIQSMGKLNMFHVPEGENGVPLPLPDARRVVEKHLIQSFRFPFWIWIFLATLGLVWSLGEWATTSLIPSFSASAFATAQKDWRNVSTTMGQKTVIILLKSPFRFC